MENEKELDQIREAAGTTGLQGIGMEVVDEI